jgi:hypothetical protein
MSQLAYLAAVSTCCDSGIENVIDPRVYAAKTHMVDPDSPTFHQAMHGEFAEESKRCSWKSLRWFSKTLGPLFHAHLA